MSRSRWPGGKKFRSPGWAGAAGDCGAVGLDGTDGGVWPKLVVVSNAAAKLNNVIRFIFYLL